MNETTFTHLFKKAISANMLSHAYLFHSKNPTKLSESIDQLINQYLHFHKQKNNMTSNATHPDILTFSEEKNIKIDTIKEIQKKVAYGPYLLPHLFIIIQNIHTLTNQAANAFLKTLEEPVDNVIFLLQTTHYQSILTTIKSRCTCIYISDSTPNKPNENILPFSTFNLLKTDKKIDLCSTLSTDKELTTQTLEYWLEELYNSSKKNSLKYCHLILKTLKTLQSNINVRLQLEALFINLEKQSS